MAPLIVPKVKLDGSGAGDGSTSAELAKAHKAVSLRWKKRRGKEKMKGAKKGERAGMEKGKVLFDMPPETMHNVN